MQRPTLALIPSGYKASKVYSALPNDGAGDFDFTRASSATRVNSEGLIETVLAGVPRLDYALVDGYVSVCPNLLLEPQRTNNLVQSNQFDTSWSVSSGINLTGGQFSGLSGKLNAWKFESDGSSGFLNINQSVSVNGINSFSLYAKSGTNNFVSLRSLSAIDVRASFNLLNGTVNSSSNTISSNIELQKDGFYKCTITFDASNDNFLIYPNIQGVSDSGFIYIQNSQLETGSFSSSYIPTTTSITTRSLEVCNNSGNSNTFNSLEGVLFAEIAALSNDLTDRKITISDGTVGDKISLSFTNQSNEILANINAGSSTSSLSTTVSNITNFNKIAVRYKENNSALFVNGVKFSFAVSLTPIVGLNELEFRDADNSGVLFAKVKDVRYYNIGLTDAELIKLTTL
jgi:hypothetical protein